MSEKILQAQYKTWEEKPILKYLYGKWYEEIVENLIQGKTLELGGGSGNLKKSFPDVVCTDIINMPWLDVLADAQKLPFRDRCFENMVLFDVLHHIENVTYFFKEADRVLKPGGRLVMMEPYISWASWPVYQFIHPEVVDLKQDPLELVTPDQQREPFDANQAIAKLVFEKHSERFKRIYPRLQVKKLKHLAFFSYLLSGGFEYPSLLPAGILKALSRAEVLFAPMGKLLAFRILIILEKQVS